MAKRQINNIEGLVALHGGTLQRLEAIEEANAALENKLVSILAGSLVVLVLILDKLRYWHLFSMLGVYFLAVAMSFCLAGAWPRDHPSSTVDLRDKKYTGYLAKPNRELLKQLIVDALGSIDAISKKNLEKSHAYQLAVSLFILGSTLCLLSLFIDSLSI